jgi:hypothetical protein
MKKNDLMGLFLIGLFNNAQAVTPVKPIIIIDNRLERCAVIALEGVSTTKGDLIGTFKFELKPDIASCGCKSASIDYESSKTEDKSLIVTSGSFPIFEPQTKKITVGNTSAPYANDVTVRFMCSPAL